MNPKKVINKHKFQRIFLKKDTWYCFSHYSTNNPDNYFESEEAVISILNGDFLYVQKLSKGVDSDGLPVFEFYRYNVKDGEPRADRIAFYKYCKVF